LLKFLLNRFEVLPAVDQVRDLIFRQPFLCTRSRPEGDRRSDANKVPQHRADRVPHSARGTRSRLVGVSVLRALRTSAWARVSLGPPRATLCPSGQVGDGNPAWGRVLARHTANLLILCSFASRRFMMGPL